MTSSAPIMTLVIAFVVVGGVDVVGNGILLYQFLYQHVFVLSFELTDLERGGRDRIFVLNASSSKHAQLTLSGV